MASGEIIENKVRRYRKTSLKKIVGVAWFFFFWLAGIAPPPTAWPGDTYDVCQGVRVNLTDFPRLEGSMLIFRRILRRNKEKK